MPKKKKNYLKNAKKERHTRLFGKLQRRRLTIVHEQTQRVIPAEQNKKIGAGVPVHRTKCNDSKIKKKTKKGLAHLVSDQTT